MGSVEKGIARRTLTNSEKVVEQMGEAINNHLTVRMNKEWLRKYSGWGTLNAINAIVDYNSARNSGRGVVGSMASAAGWFAAGEVLGFKMIPLMALGHVPSAAVSSIEKTDQLVRNMQMTNMYKNTPFFNARFQDTQAAYTMRQAGMQVAKNTQYRLEQTMLGNEAQYMKR